MAYHSRFTISCLAALLLTAVSLLAVPQRHQGEKFVYQIKKGDTIRGLANRYMGGEEFVDELLRYNRITNPAVMRPGFFIAVPGSERERAGAVLAEAEAELAVAIEAHGETYAKDEMDSARMVIEEARQLRHDTTYDRAAAMAELGVERARYARKLADERAPVQQEAKVTGTHGLVEVSLNDEASWETVSSGIALPVGSLVRTGVASRAEVTLGDGSVIQLVPQSKVKIEDALWDHRNNRRSSKLNVLIGNILGEIEPKQNKDSKFELRSGETTLSIRGTGLRVVRQDGVSRVSLLNGKITVNSAAEDLPVTSNFGVVVTDNEPPPAPILLLPPPLPLLPEEMDHHTARQAIEFVWEELDRPADLGRSHGMTENWHAVKPMKRFSRYHLEVAKDERFNQVVVDVLTKKDRYVSKPLAEGAYYWRLATLDRDGLEGQFSATRQITIRKALDLQLIPLATPIEREGTMIVSPNHNLKVSPVADDNSVKSLEISVDGAPFKPLYGLISLREHGAHSVRVHAIAEDGSKGPDLLKHVRVDAVPPTATATVEAAKLDLFREEIVVVRVRLAATDDETGVARIEFSLDGENFRTYRDSTPPEVVLDEYQVLYYRAVDGVGNVSEVAEVELD